jgi:hypothetical protein
MDALNDGAVEQQKVAPVIFVSLDFPSGIVWVSSLIGTYTWGGFDWLGVGMFGDVSGLEESAELSRKTVQYTLRGVPNDLVAAALSEDYQGRPAKIYIGFLGTTTYQLVADPELLDSGLLDVSGIKLGQTATLTITAESRIAAWSRPVIRRYTDAEQQRRFPGDKGLEFISQAAQKEIVWGRKS